MADNILELKGIYKIYNDADRKICVLEDVSFGVKPGEFVVLLGPSGSGKSTLLNLAGLLDHPTHGDIVFEGRDMRHLHEKHRAETRLKKIGFVFQFDSLLPEFTMLENVDLPAMLAGRPDSEQALALLENFGLKNLAEKMPSELSGGEKQRAAIARALRNKPVLLLADEPTGNLDEDNSAVVFNDFRRLADSGVAVLMATHNTRAGAFADRILRIRHNRITETEEPLPETK